MIDNIKNFKGFGILNVSIILVLFLMVSISGNAQEKVEPAEKEKNPVKAQEKKAEEKKPEEKKEIVPPVQQGPLVSYLIEAVLHDKEKKVTATETMSWRNDTKHTVDHLRFHLYYNAFRNLNSTYMREKQNYKKSKEWLKKARFGEVKINEIRRINGSDLSANMSFIAPDDGNKDDRTVMKLDLINPVEPGQSIRLMMKFTLTIPQIFDRTGNEGDYFFMAQWFPKVGVMQQDGQWNCHQFHGNSEFFADFGEYKVALTIPGKYVVGATGNQVKAEKNADRTVTYFYEEENIHDFAWTAYPDFEKFTQKIKLEGDNKETEIELLLSPGHGFAKDLYLDSLKFSMQFFARHIYPYPYKKITLVDPPLAGVRSKGMEYPTLITGGTMGMIPDGVKATELVTIHEFGHEYFYGIIATDEFREAWLDEGVTSYYELEVLDEYFKNSPSALDWDFMPIYAKQSHRLRGSMMRFVDPVNQYAWKFANRSEYAANSYSKSAVILWSLRNLVGKERMMGFIKYYAQKYKFKHPTGEDFKDSFNAYMNEDFTWAFDLYFNSHSGLDQSVHSIHSKQVPGNPKMYRNDVLFKRNEGYFPVDLVITLENGKEIKSFWKDKEKWKRITFDDTSRIKKAVLDPEYKIILDRNYLNNSKVRKPDRSGIKRLALKLGFLFQGIVSLFTL